jgi:hypothetical protein
MRKNFISSFAYNQKLHEKIILPYDTTKYSVYLEQHLGLHLMLYNLYEFITKHF